MALNIILLSFSVVLSTAYLIYIRRFGKKPSVSAYADPLTQNDQEFLTYVFIWLGLSFPLAFISNHWLTTFAAVLLALDGLFTGYNPTHLRRAWQNIIHVIGVNGAIGFFIIGIFVINWKIALLTLPIGIIALFLWIRKVKRHTYWIEILVMIWIWVFLLIEKIIL